MSENNASSQERVFVRGNEHLDRLLSDPQVAADVAQAHADAEEMDRVYAMNLAMIRKAAQMTQVEVAKKLGVGQAAVSRLESREDMLLSTLYDYLTATGADADAASIVVIVHGQRIELTIFNSGVTERREVQTGAVEEPLEKAGPVLHPFEPGLDQRGQLGQ